ncbi:MAG: hypothetical protein PHZ19_05020 [Candidatus Thermoplasmatota archaeon]|nr:hypothetical protein [Candidatus Thermoplasmatota archaeon]
MGYNHYYCPLCGNKFRVREEHDSHRCIHCLGRRLVKMRKRDYMLGRTPTRESSLADFAESGREGPGESRRRCDSRGVV